jgi:hypothetical protein
MELLISDLDPSQSLASPLGVEAPSVEFELDELLNHDSPLMDDWLAGTQGALVGDGSNCRSLPPSSDGPLSGKIPSPSAYYVNNSKIESAATGQSSKASNGTHSSNTLEVQHVDSFASHAPATLLRIQPSKPGRKKTHKSRPKDKLESLQKQLDDIMAQVQQLTLVNEQLHCKNEVLTSLLECSDEVGLLTACATRQLEACIRDPAGPHPPVIQTMHSLTPQSWLACYNGTLVEMSRCLMSCGGPNQVASEEAAKQLATVCKVDLLLHIQYAIALRREVFFEVQRITYEQFTHKHREVRPPASRLQPLFPPHLPPSCIAACCQWWWCCSFCGRGSGQRQTSRAVADGGPLLRPPQKATQGRLPPLMLVVASCYGSPNHPHPQLSSGRG